jgi:hypoxanthine phosphoribosyltransferase
MTHRLTPLMSREQISQEVDRLAAELKRAYQGHNPLLLGVLKGSFIFLSDLVRRLDFPVEVDFIQVVSYGDATFSSGRVKLIQRPLCPVKGRHVILVEDIVDTGLTTCFLLEYLGRRRPLSLELCALFDKPERRQTPVTIDYLGFSVPNRFLVGYGLDCAQQYRNLPDLWVLDEECPE